MILRTIRDVEIELRKLLAQIEELKAKKVIATGINAEQALALINSRIREVKVDAPQSVKFQPEDIDSANHSGTIIHNLVHIFNEDVTFDDVTFTGTVTGLPGSGGFSQLVRQSTNLTLPNGTYADLPALTMNILNNGIYLLHAIITCNFQLNDSDAGIKAVHNQAGPFIDMTGSMQLSKPTADSTRTVIVSQQWLFNPTNPCIVKLQGFKLGTGGSTTITGDSTFSAIKVG